MKALLINPEDQTITETEYNGDYHEIYKLISCDTFDVVRIDAINSVYVDDEGLLKDPEFFFKLKGYPQPIVGKGLVLGSDEEGESVATTLTTKELANLVSFERLKVEGFQEFKGETTRFGEKAFVIGHTPIFSKLGNQSDD